MKQFVPYAKFLVRAYQVKRDPAAPPRDASSDAVTTLLGSRLVRIVVALGLLIWLLWISHPGGVWRVASSAARCSVAHAVGLTAVRPRADGVALARPARAGPAEARPSLGAHDADLLREHVRRHVPARKRRW